MEFLSINTHAPCTNNIAKSKIIMKEKRFESEFLKHNGTFQLKVNRENLKRHQTKNEAPTTSILTNRQQSNEIANKRL